MIDQESMYYWRRALANVRAGAANAKVALIGDSTTAGYGSAGNGFVNARSKSYPSMLSSILNCSLVSAECDSFWGDSVCGIAYGSYDSRVSVGAGWAIYSGAASNYSLGGSMLTNNSSANLLGFTPSNQTDSCDIYYVQSPGNGSLQVNVNGGTPLAAINSNGASSVQRVTVAAPLGNNVWGFAWGGGGAVYIVGVHAYNSGARRVALFGMGAGGTTAAHWAQAAFSWNPVPALQVVAPDLTIICLGINDWNQGVAPGAFGGSLQAVISAALASGDVVVMSPVPSQGATVAPSAQFSLVRSMRPKVDLFRRWRSYEVAQPIGYYYDALHPSALGYADIAAAVAALLSE